MSTRDQNDRCDAVASYECEAPPGGARLAAKLFTCYRCGLPVCGPCSKLVINRRRKRSRFCANCIDEAIRFDEGVNEIGGATLRPLHGEA